MSAAPGPQPPTSSPGPGRERSEGERARADRTPLDLTLAPEEVPEVVRFVNEMRAKKAVEQPSQATMVNAALLNSITDLTKAIKDLRDDIMNITTEVAPSEQ